MALRIFLGCLPRGLGNPGGGGSETLIAPPVVAIALAALVPIVGSGVTISPSATDIALAAAVPVVAAGVTVAPPVTDIALAAQVPTVTAGSGSVAGELNFDFSDANHSLTLAI